MIIKNPFSSSFASGRSDVSQTLLENGKAIYKFYFTPASKIFFPFCSPSTSRLFTE